jgi:DNA-binding response OmpR family regulator
MPEVADQMSEIGTNRVERPLESTRILIAEDEVIIAMELQSMIEDYGLQVVGPAHTLKHATELALREDISAAILDLCLGRDAISAVARILETRQIPFIFYSGQAANDPIRMEWPDHSVISKPADADRLLACLAVLLEPDGEKDAAEDPPIRHFGRS